MKVLIAEDDLVSRNLLERVLDKWGYEVIVTCDGEEAWDVFQSNEAPRLAVLDWMMPGLDGPDVCRRIRDLDLQDPPYIILLTARGLHAAKCTPEFERLRHMPFIRQERNGNPRVSPVNRARDGVLCRGPVPRDRRRSP